MILTFGFKNKAVFFTVSFQSRDPKKHTHIRTETQCKDLLHLQTPSSLFSSLSLSILSNYYESFNNYSKPTGNLCRHMNDKKLEMELTLTPDINIPYTDT